MRTVETLHKYCKIDDPDELEVSLSLDAQIWSDLTHWLLQREAVRFEKAVVETSKENGRQGIVQLPGVSAIMDEVRLYQSLIFQPSI